MTEEKDLFQLRKRSFSQNDLNKDFWFLPKKKYHLPQIVAKNGPSFAEVVTQYFSAIFCPLFLHLIQSYFCKPKTRSQSCVNLQFDGNRKIPPFGGGGGLHGLLKPSKSVEFLRSKIQSWINGSSDDNTGSIRKFGLKWKARARKQSLRRYFTEIGLKKEKKNRNTIFSLFFVQSFLITFLLYFSGKQYQLFVKGEVWMWTPSMFIQNNQGPLYHY